jgi:hypothetical protein
MTPKDAECELLKVQPSPQGDGRQREADSEIELV